MAGISKLTPLETWQWVMTEANWQTAAEMARAVNLPDSTCRSYIYHGQLPTVDKAARIAEAAKIDLGELAKRLATK